MIPARKLCFCGGKGVFFRVLGLFWGVLGDFGAQTRHFFSFFGVASLLREGVGVLEITPHLLNAEAHGRAVARTVQPLVGASGLEGK